MKRSLILSAVLLAALAIGCGVRTQSSANPTPETKAAENPLRNTFWQTESYGAADNQQTVKDNSADGKGFQPGIEFTDKKAGGRLAGCNILSFEYTVDGSKLKAKFESSTVMACHEEIMRQERELSEAFGKAESFRLEADRLEIVYEGGKKIRFKRAEKTK